MAFPRDLLAEHETVVFDLQPHWIALVRPVLWTVLLVAAVIAGAVLTEGIALLLIGAVAVVVWFYIAALPLLRWRYTMFVLTTDRLITRTGVVAKHSKELPLERINDVSFNQTVFERMLGAGDLLVESAGERGQTRITDVRHPEQVQLMIYKESEKNQNRMFRPETPAAPSVTDQIEDLARLRDQGIISAAEFETKKQELLRRL